jgi:hypothetical protein
MLALTIRGSAQVIPAAGGEERTDVTLSVRPVPAVRLSGRLVTPDGSAPPPTTIRLIGAGMTDVITTGLVTGPDHVGFETVTGMSDATSRFTLLGVPAGEYVLTHANRFLSRAIQQGQPASGFPSPLPSAPTISRISSWRFDPRFASKGGSNTAVGAARR